MQTSQNLSFSTRRRRISAFLIDHGIITFLIVATIFLMLGSNIDESVDGKMSGIMLSVMLPGFILYFLKDLMGGVSLGKWILGIMVRDADNKNKVPAFGRLVGRNLFVILWPIEFIVLALSREKRRLGDTIMKTIVVDNPDKPKKLFRALASVAIALVIFGFMFLYVGSLMRNSEAYKVAVHEISQNDEILEETGEIEGYGMFPTGNVNISNGVGEAYLEINVSGTERDLKVSVYLTKEPNGEWKVVDLKKKN